MTIDGDVVDDDNDDDGDVMHVGNYATFNPADFNSLYL